MSEVLISMLIMAVGVVSLAAIFPASVLRSIQASQLTNAAILAKNTRARLEYDSSILGGASWAIPLVATNSGFDGAKTSHNVLVDPFGVMNGLGSIGVLPRTSGLAALSKSTAEQLAALPDSWSLIRDDVVSGGYTAGSYQVALAIPSTALDNINPRTFSGAGVSNPLYRIILIDATGKNAARRTLRRVIGSSVSWLDTDVTAPTEDDVSFIPARARIEVRENRYTSIITVRKRALDSLFISWTAEVDLAVVFNRSYNAVDETVLTGTLTGAPGFDGENGVAGVDDDLVGGNNSPGEASWPGSDDLRTIKCDTPLPQNLKRGSFLLETKNARWYRVINIDSENDLILVDRDIVGSALSFCVMKGVVQVFELGNFAGSQ